MFDKGWLRKLHKDEKGGIHVQLIPTDRTGKRFALNSKKVSEATYTIEIEWFRSVLDLTKELYKKGDVYQSQMDFSKAFCAVLWEQIKGKEIYIRWKGERYTFTRMQFGFGSSTAIFSDIVENLFGHLKGSKSYVDNLYIRNKTYLAHKENVCRMAIIAYRNNLPLNITKSKFMIDELDFLGFKVSKDGIRLDDNIVQDVKDYPTPTCKTELESFIGLIQFCTDYIPALATAMEPLRDTLAKTNTTIRPEYQEKVEKTTQLLKDIIEKKIALNLPPSEKGTKFGLYTDASDIGIGGVAGYWTKEGSFAPMGFFSRKLKKYEKNYEVYKKEMLAIVYGLAKYEHIMKGREIIVFSDHQALQSKNDGKRSRTEMHWWQYINSLQAKIYHIEGKKNTCADALSRKPNERCPEDDFTIEKAIFSVINAGEETDQNKINDIIKKVTQLHNLDHGNAIITANRFIEEYGNDEKINIRKIAKEVVENCIPCAKFNNHVKKYLPSKHVNANYVWERLQIDLAGPFPCDEDGYKYVLLLVDNFSGYVDLQPLTGKSAEDIAKAILKTITNYGVPNEIQSDCAKEFISALQSALKWLEINHETSAPYNPRSNGKVERFVGSMKKALQKVLDKKQLEPERWIDYIDHIKLLLNSRSSTGTRQLSPFFIMFGRYPRLIGNGNYNIKELQEWLMHQTNITSKLYSQLKKDYEQYYKLVNEKVDSKRKVQVEPYKIGTKVMYESRLIGFDKSKYEGPFEITEINERNNYFIKDKNGIVIDRKFTHDQLKQVSQKIQLTELQGGKQPQFEQVGEVSNQEIDEEKEYEVKAILGTRIKNKVRQVLVQWKDFSHNTWLSMNNLGETLLNQYKQKLHENNYNKKTSLVIT